MRVRWILAAATAALVASPSLAGVFIVEAANPIAAIPNSNFFRARLAGEGLAFFTAEGASISLSSASRLSFEMLGHQSGFHNSFKVGGATILSETSSGAVSLWHSPVSAGTFAYAAGPISDWLFTSDKGLKDQGIGTSAFGIFLPAGVAGGSMLRTRTLYLGFDDQIFNPDDNHDDLVIRVTASVPEPATWAMLIGGFGLVGMAARRQRRLGLSRVAA